VFDVAVVIGLTVVAYLVRRGGLPTNGFWFDDSWVAAGVLFGKPSSLMTVGSGQPVFTGLLMAWHALTGFDGRGLAYPTLVIGAIGPALLYLGLRGFGYERSTSLLLSAAFVVADIDILYSGRVKPYAFDPLIVLGVVLAVTRLAPRTWHWWMAAAWAVASWILGMFSGYVLLATACAGLILLLHPARDRGVRFAAVAAQAVGSLFFLEWAERSTDLSGIEGVMKTSFDAHLQFHANPLAFGREILTHIERVATMYPGGSGRWVTALALAAIVGLVVASVRGVSRVETLAARTFLLMIAVAFMGALVGKFPFGPTTTGAVSSGARHALWLVPAMATGLASLLHRLRLLAAARVDLQVVYDVAALAIAVVVLVAGYHQASPYPYPGGRSAERYLASHLQPGDVALVDNGGIYGVADGSGLPFTLRPTPDRQIGFTPVFADPRIHTIGEFGETAGTPAQVHALVSPAKRVLVETEGILGLFVVGKLDKSLRSAGFHEQEKQFFGKNVVQVWTR
jgi:hypothetical protein